MTTLMQIVAALFVWFVLFEVARRSPLRQVLADRAADRIDELTLEIEDRIDEWAEELDLPRDEVADDVRGLMATRMTELEIACHRLVLDLVKVHT